MSNYASFGRRFAALILDALVLVIPGLILERVLPYVGGVVAWFLYAPILEASDLKGTLGKYWMGIQVTDANGNKLTFQGSLLRNVVKFFSSALCCLGYALALFTEKKQTLHDLAADTIVVYGRSPADVPTAWKESARSVFGVGASGTDNSSDKLAQLERLQNLREKGTITEEEFQKAKKDIIG